MYVQLLKLTIVSLFLTTFGNGQLSADVFPSMWETSFHKSPLTHTQGSGGFSPQKNPVFLAGKQTNLERNTLEIARQITVKIASDSGEGSGVIIARRGRTYTVLTNKHVLIQQNDEAQYKVLTTDGVAHLAQQIRFSQFGNLDLAIVQFTSDTNYRIAEFRNSNSLTVSDSVYASGFPSRSFFDPNNSVSPGLQGLKITKGIIGMLLERSLFQGYQLGYTNDIEIGMSGGPVIDANGYLIGINGRLKYPFSGRNTYAFENGSMPSEELAKKMEPLSWAIPITRLQKINLQKFGKE